MQDRPFLTIDEQVERLKTRGLSVDAETPSILLREGYYSIVNGYKTPFIDAEATEKAGDDRYNSGTSFNDLYALFCFDRDLREITFKHLVQVEATMRTVCSHTFAENHREKDAYLIQGNFCTSEEYREFGLKNYMDNLLKLQTTLYHVASKSRDDSIAHYRKRGNVPLWVLSKALTFGNVEHFFHMMNPREKEVACRRIVEATNRDGDGHSYLSPKQVRLSLNSIVKFRNICAHDERLYCARVGRRDPIVDYATLLEKVEPFLTESDYELLLSEFVLTVIAYSERSYLALHILQESGVLRLFNRAVKAASKRLDSDDAADKLARVKIAIQTTAAVRPAHEEEAASLQAGEGV